MVALRLGGEAVSIMGEDGLLERRVMPRLLGIEIPVGALSFPGQEGR